MELDRDDLKRGLRFIVGTWQVSYLTNPWVDAEKQIPATEFKDDAGNDFTAITYTFTEDHKLVMKNAANGKEEEGTWEQTGYGEFHYTLNGFLNIPESTFLNAAETLSVRNENELVFSLGFLAIFLKKTEEGTMTEEPDIGDLEPSAEDLAMTGIVGVYEVAKTMAFLNDEYALFSREEVVADLDKKKAAGEIDDEEYADSLQGFEAVIEFTDDHRVVEWLKMPAGVSEEEIKAAVEAGEIMAAKDGFFATGAKEWKALNGKYYYNSGEERELFGEKQSPWDELKTDEEGLLDFASGMMKLRKKEA